MKIQSNKTSCFFFFLFVLDNVELIMKNVAVRHCSDSQDNDQPDYDSVASDEDTDQELPSSKGDRTKVPRQYFHKLKPWMKSLLHHSPLCFVWHVFYRAWTRTSQTDPSLCKNTWRWKPPSLPLKQKSSNSWKQTTVWAMSWGSCRKRYPPRSTRKITNIEGRTRRGGGTAVSRALLLHSANALWCGGPACV